MWRDFFLLLFLVHFHLPRSRLPTSFCANTLLAQERIADHATARTHANAGLPHRPRAGRILSICATPATLLACPRVLGKRPKTDQSLPASTRPAAFAGHAFDFEFSLPLPLPLPLV